MSKLDQLEVAIREYIKAMPKPLESALNRIDRTVVKELRFSGLRPDWYSPQVIGQIQVFCHDGTVGFSPIYINIDEIDRGIAPIYLYDRIESAIVNSLEAVNGLVYEDPFVTWAKEVRRDAGVA